MGDLISGLIASIAVTGGNQHDSIPAARLIRRARQLSFGLQSAQSAQLQAHVIAMRCNLALFAKQMLSAQQRPVVEMAA